MKKDLYQYVSVGRHWFHELKPILNVLNKCCIKNTKKYVNEHKKSGILSKIFCRECCNTLVLGYVTPDDEGLLDRGVCFIGNPSEKFYRMYEKYVGIIGN